jgi:hypothetical protein
LPCVLAQVVLALRHEKARSQSKSPKESIAQAAQPNHAGRR